MTVGAGSGSGRQRPARRTVLSALSLAVVAGPALAACTSGGGPGPGPTRGGTTAAPDADDAALARAVATTNRLLGLLAAATGVPAAVRAAVAADHRAHLVALGVPAAAVTATPTGTPTGTPAGTPAATPTGTPTGDAAAPRPGPRALVAAERAAAKQALADAAGTGRPVAALLVRVAAARAVHADVLARATDVAVPGPVDAGTPAGSPTGSPTGSAGPPAAAPSGLAALPTLTPSPATSRAADDLDALARLVDAEHAAVFAYALVVPRVAPARRARADAVWTEHRRSRDAVEALLVAAGTTPPAALPAYAVDPPATPRAAAALAADVEAGVARVAAWSAGRGSGEVRALAGTVAVAAARRRAEWLGAVPPFTG